MLSKYVSIRKTKSKKNVGDEEGEDKDLADDDNWLLF